ncbi:MAG: cyclic nucleotide-binding domain-containing protein [Desulfovibrio sp.]|nr:MAG: cyclic nucleotide-binding domain-containing protein [Desulfovibrio sp.]
MATPSDLTPLALFEGIAEPALDKLAGLATLQSFAQGDVIYTFDEVSTFFGVVVTGRIMIEREVTPDIIATTETLNPGDPFGLSSLIHGARHKGAAHCREDSEVLLFTGTEVMALLDEEPELGAKLLSRLYAVAVERLHVRTNQFIKLLGLNPELKAAMGD